MFNSAILDVAVALAFVLLLASLLVSALNELIAGLVKQRAKSLWRGIAELVRSDSLRDALYDHPIIKSLAPPVSNCPKEDARAILHPGQNVHRRASRPPARAERHDPPGPGCA